MIGSRMIAACGERPALVCDSVGSMGPAACHEITGRAALGCGELWDAAASKDAQYVMGACQDWRGDGAHQCKWNDVANDAKGAGALCSCKDKRLKGIAVDPSGKVFVGCQSAVETDAGIFLCEASGVVTVKAGDPCYPLGKTVEALSIDSRGDMYVGCGLGMLKYCAGFDPVTPSLGVCMDVVPIGGSCPTIYGAFEAEAENGVVVACGTHMLFCLTDHTDSPSRSPTPGLLTALPTVAPSSAPSIHGFPSRPSSAPTTMPSRVTAAPSRVPAAAPSGAPSRGPTASAAAPTATPLAQPSRAPTSTPSSTPVPPTQVPLAPPPRPPSTPPSSYLPPTAKPSAVPTMTPSTPPTTEQPTRSPSMPTGSPTAQPSRVPTAGPSASPIAVPTAGPSAWPSVEPSTLPTSTPSVFPSGSPTLNPLVLPTSTPSIFPSGSPTTIPSALPTTKPSALPTAKPSALPTVRPSVSRLLPSERPSPGPSMVPSAVLSTSPSAEPVPVPSSAPSSAPELLSYPPTSIPSSRPSQGTLPPTLRPTLPPQNSSLFPSASPSAAPMPPSAVPTRRPVPTPLGHRPPAAAEQALFGGVSVAAVLDTPAPGMTALALTGGVSCPEYERPDELSFPLHPLRFAVSGDIFLGALLGNSILSLGVAILGGLAMVATRWIAGRTRGWTPLQLQALVRLPGKLLLTPVLLYQGVSYAMVRTMAAPPTAGFLPVIFWNVLGLKPYKPLVARRAIQAQLAETLMISVLSALMVSSDSLCAPFNFGLAGIFLAHGVWCLLAQPHARPRDELNEALQSLLLATGVVFKASGYYTGDPNNSKFQTANVLMTVAAISTAGQFLLDVGSEVYIRWTRRRGRLEALHLQQNAPAEAISEEPLTVELPEEGPNKTVHSSGSGLPLPLLSMTSNDLGAQHHHPEPLSPTVPGRPGRVPSPFQSDSGDVRSSLGARATTSMMSRFGSSDLHASVRSGGRSQRRRQHQLASTGLGSASLHSPRGSPRRHLRSSHASTPDSPFGRAGGSNSPRRSARTTTHPRAREHEGKAVGV
eukprot:TRINITY_DN9928_c0_g1_i1.p1 TRINITY_DN9928_c0_g1~~TRINITY_DN9928_c0_g1_i1.p1  ORF type:complete len:1132 (+),score=33.20 TRINITY_DN9928_c0_g1_i1:274-3396(+)